MLIGAESVRNRLCAQHLARVFSTIHSIFITRLNRVTGVPSRGTFQILSLSRGSFGSYGGFLQKECLSRGSFGNLNLSRGILSLGSQSARRYYAYLREIIHLSARLTIAFDLKPSHILLAIFSLPTFDLFGSSLQSPNRFFHCYGLEMHERVDSSKTTSVSALMVQIQFYGTKYDSA